MKSLLAAMALLGLSAGCASISTKSAAEGQTQQKEFAQDKLVENKDGKASSWATVSGLKVEEKKLGQGAEAKKGSTVVVFYVARDEEGKRIHSSHNLGHPFSFELGKGQVIDGWEEGMLGMKVGGQRKITVPPHLGYGDKRAANQDASIDIKKDSTLVYEIKLIEVK